MSCAATVPTFRLLDPIVGWDTANSSGLTGFDGDEGLTLLPRDPGAVPGDALAPYMLPAWLAPGCGPCAWWLATPPIEGLIARLLRLDPCGNAWCDAWPPPRAPIDVSAVTVIAATGECLAAASAGMVHLLEGDGPAYTTSFPCAGVRAMTFGSHCVLFVVVVGRDRIARFDRGGMALTPFAAALPVPVDEIQRLTATSDGAVWLATSGAVAGTFRLWRAADGAPGFVQGDIADLMAQVPATSLVDANLSGFCLDRGARQGPRDVRCYSRYGRPLAKIAPNGHPLYSSPGSYATLPIDSGVPRCVWHRVRIDAELPAGTILTTAVASAETTDAPPHPLDWRESNLHDFLIQQPPGRYLYLRLTLRSLDGLASPAVRRIRLDFPRASSIDLLPAVYRDDPDSADFTARFLSLFDAAIADLDDAIARAPALLDAGGVRDDVLPWLGSFFGLVFDPAWDAARRRTILQRIPDLYRLRGTPAGLRLAFRLVFDVDPAIQELGPMRAWAGLGRQSRLGQLRLFGRNRARATLGRSVLGSTVLKSWGDPARDPLDVLANRVRVLLPPASSQPGPGLVQALLDSQKPAHVLASLRTGSGLFIVGPETAIGIDTGFVPPPVPVLGRAGNVRLNRASILYRRRSPPPAGMVVGRQHLME